MYKNNKMGTITEIVETIRHDIHLHEKLNDIVAEERKYIENNDLDFASEHIRNRAKLEKEIESTNRSIVNLFLVTDVNSQDIDIEKRKEIVMLMNLLRETIKDTLNFVNKTVTYLKKDKAETSVQLRQIGKSRIALNSYARYGTV